MYDRRIMLALAVMALALWGVAQAPVISSPSARTFIGATKRLGNGSITTFLQVNPDGAPVEMGVTFPARTLTGLPATDTSVNLVWPFESYTTPFTHFAIDWNPHGHDPLQFYAAPHFDFHFYMLMPDEREQITATGSNLALVNKAPAAQYVPRGYVATPGGVPHMGAHWVNPASPEFHGQPFTQTLIYGFYNGVMAFIEPMVSLDYLRTQPVIVAPIPQPQAYFTHDYYPTQYLIQYDGLNQNYIIALTGFVKR